MSRPASPALTVRYDGSTRTFAAGNDVVVGRDLRADVRIAHPLISRAHLVLRFDQGRWVAIDNGSLNGMFVGGRRVPAASHWKRSGVWPIERSTSRHATAWQPQQDWEADSHSMNFPRNRIRAVDEVR